MRYFFLILSFFSATVNGAPIPATSSSAVVKSTHDYFISKMGFSINASNAQWTSETPPRNIPTLVAIYRNPKVEHGMQASLSIRYDHLKQQMPMKQFVKQWIKDYPRLGFEILSSKPLKVNGSAAFLIDTIHREGSKQLRQVVFLKEKKAVILTCRDHKDSFEKSVKGCNEIIRTFKWLI